MNVINKNNSLFILLQSTKFYVQIKRLEVQFLLHSTERIGFVGLGKGGQQEYTFITNENFPRKHIICPTRLQQLLAHVSNQNFGRNFIFQFSEPF